MKNLISNKQQAISIFTLICLVFFTFNNKQLLAQCGISNFSGNGNTGNGFGNNNFAPQNIGICNDYMNYIPDKNNPDHTVEKVIKLNFHFMLRNDPLDPHNLTATTGFLANNAIANGIDFAQDQITRINNWLAVNAPAMLPHPNSILNLNPRLKVELYHDPNVQSDNGVYFHTFSDWTTGTSSHYWYNYYSDYKTLFSVNGDKVIDVFFTDFPGNSPSDGGFANGLSVSSGAFINLPDVFDAQNVGFVYPHNIAGTIIHEIFHTFGLNHTNIPDGCSDTYQNPQGVGCYSWPGSNWSIFDNNYMSYCGHNSNETITPEQLGKIHKFFETQHPLYVTNTDECRTQNSQDITIKTGETILWNSTKHLRGSVIVEKDATLTVTCDLFFKELAYLKVQAGGKLIVDGGKLTSECSDKLWTGVSVCGDDTKFQNNIYQGEIVCKNGAEISNAIIGIRTGDFYWDMADLSWPQFYNKTGGIINASSSIFRNNRKAIEFMKYHNIEPTNLVVYDNVSNITNCTFVNDNKLLGYDYSSFGWAPEFITMWEVENVPITDNTFVANLTGSNFSPDVPHRPGAIGSYAATYKLKNNRFTNLQSGVWALGYGSSIGNIFINKNEIDNTYSCISTEATNGDVISGNKINSLPETLFGSVPLPDNFAWGIYTNYSNDFLIHDNAIASDKPIGYFVSFGGNDDAILPSAVNNWAIINSNTEIGQSIVAENTSLNQTTALQPEDLNTALQYACNSLTGNSINMHINPYSPAGYLNDQGQLNGAKTNNFYNDGCNGSLFKNHIRSTIGFTYFDNVSNPNPPSTTCISNNVSFNNVNQNQKTCNEYTPFTGGNPDHDYSKLNLIGKSDLEKQNMLLASATYHGGKGEYGKCATALGALGTVEAGKRLCALYYNINDIPKAKYWLSKINDNSLLPDQLNLKENSIAITNKRIAELKDYVSLFTVLIGNSENNKNIFSLSSESKAQLKALATQDTKAGHIAANTLNFTQGKMGKMIPEKPMAKNAINKKTATTTLTQSAFSITPIPFTTILNVNTSLLPTEAGVLKITDITGKLILTIPISSNYMQVPTTTLESGVYMATLTVNGRLASTIKIIK